MKTKLTRSPDVAAGFIKNGGIVAFPTETVYGLGADIFDENAIGNIFKAKDRPADNPLIAHVANLDQIKLIAKEIPPDAVKLIREFFPGPLTVVLQRSADVPLIATANLETVGVRMPRNELAARFLEKCGTPLVAPSANLSGKPSPTTWNAVFEDLNGRIDCILQGETTEIGLESTVVDCTLENPLILRSGAIILEQLRAIVPNIGYHAENGEHQPKSPGMKHRHYSPGAKVVLADSGFTASDPGSSAFIGFDPGEIEFALVKQCESLADYARSVFEFFRKCDASGIETIYCEPVEEQGLGVALMDRLRRAAE